MNYRIIFFLILFSGNVLKAQQSGARPQLVVGIVVDQMSYDLLYRFWPNYSENGFKRLVRYGYSCENNHYYYVPTYTGPGHASIYTGTVPAVHGIVANNWFDKVHGNGWYCSTDTNVTGVGAIGSSGQMSPANMLSTTITDQLKLSLGDDAKVIGIAMKDRGAILPAGHAADAAYWFDGYANAWISSTYYMDALPVWLQAFNASQPANKLMSDDWHTLLPISAYTHGTADDVPWEWVGAQETAPVFPHITRTDTIMEHIKGTPFGNTLTALMARQVIEHEAMGKDGVTDFLCVSFSSTDYVGHDYGPHSVETEDTYLRLDKDLAELLEYLDLKVGEQNYLVFLTSDHGVAPVPGYMESLHIPSGLLNGTLLSAEMEAVLDAQIGVGDWIRFYTNQQLYLNEAAMRQHDTDPEAIAGILQYWADSTDGVARVISTRNIQESTLPAVHREMLINGIYPKRCGEILVVYDPNWISYGPTGSTHGSHYAYDTQVPLLWYGWKIRNGKTWRRTSISDIAPTIAAMLRIPQPNGCIGSVIEEMKNE